MEIGAQFVAGCVFGAAILYLATRRRAPSTPVERPARTKPAPSPGSAVGGSVLMNGPSGTNATTAAAADPVTGPIRQRLLRIASEATDVFNASATPADLHDCGEFEDGVALMLAEVPSVAELYGYYNGDNAILSCMALEALRRRQGELPNLFGAVTEMWNTVGIWQRGFALRLLAERADPPRIGRVLATIDETWLTHRQARLFLLDFLDAAVAAGEPPTMGAWIERVPKARREMLTQLLASGDRAPAVALVREIQAYAGAALDVDLLRSVGRILTVEDAAGAIPHPALELAANELLAKLSGTPGSTGAVRRSVLVVGPAGVGKSSLVRRVARILGDRGATLFEASGAEIIAGQKFIGEHEERVRNLVAALGGGRSVIWYAPRFHELMTSGRTRENPSATFDLLAPAIERGEIQMIGELDARAADALLRRHPRLRALFEVVTIVPLDDAATIALAADVLKAKGEARAEAGFGATPPAVLREALELANQFVTQVESPGRVLELLERAVAGVRRDEGADRPLAREDLSTALSRLTGLPAAILDENATLDLDALREFFSRRVIGQDEAVSCLVDRIAMLKAGLCDPRRPVGVFLFTGPTGTGKTELAKSLAECLFGSADRMLRYDMSEFQSPDSPDWLGRLIGESGSGSDLYGQALVDRIRAQPFAVVLLDEFEKAHPQVFDLFLQLFDDGRLTDRKGNTADFRHAIVIMTSNLGGDIAREGSIGFRTPRAARSERAIAGSRLGRALGGAFRKEFINRIDRVVQFQPLARSVMRDILMKELAAVLNRRGLRNKTWAVEWEPSAIDFLLDRGFTPDLGARPLRRAIEQYLLAPLASTILAHRVPRGDQFLFVRSAGDRLEVEFVDPDAPDASSAPDASTTPRAVPLALRDVVLDATGERGEIEFLGRELERLRSVFRGDDWTRVKAARLDQMGAPEFWTSPARFAVLEVAEYMDRLGVGFETAESLWSRLGASRGEARERLPAALATRLAHELWLLDEARLGLERGDPLDAWIAVESEGDADSIEAARRVVAMYRGWVAKRRMRMLVLESEGGAPQAAGPRFVAAISGFAAYSLLRHEHGLHVFEKRAVSGRPERVSVRVRVVAQPPEPMPRDLDEHRGLAARTLAECAVALRIVRRYTSEPSPLVRDAVRGYRTGRFDRVLEGDFDLFS